MGRYERERLLGFDQEIDAVLILFRRGLSTKDIAELWMVPESDVARALVAGREGLRVKA